MFFPRKTLSAWLFPVMLSDSNGGRVLLLLEKTVQALLSNHEATFRGGPMAFLSVTEEYIGSSELEVKRKKG
jgi:hypothetical protein